MSERPQLEFCISTDYLNQFLSNAKFTHMINGFCLGNYSCSMCRYKLYIKDVNNNSMHSEIYENNDRADSMEETVEEWLKSEHNATWGDTIYDTFNSPDNKSPKSSFLEPFVTKENQPDPPEDRIDFEHLDESEYVSRVPIPVAERIGKKVRSNLTKQQKSLLATIIAGCDSVDDIDKQFYTGVPYVSGLPDILAWEEDEPKDGSYKFFEVKKFDRKSGYQDGIGVDQALWFSFFDYFDSYVVYIEELNSDS